MILYNSNVKTIVQVIIARHLMERVGVYPLPNVVTNASH